MITYVKGDAAQPVGEGPRVLLHVVNDQGGWGKGFVLALAYYWPKAKAAYREWAVGRVPSSPFVLGQVQFVHVDPQLWVANVLAQAGYKSAWNPVPFRLRYFRQALSSVRAFCLEHGATVHMPRVGTGLGGACWEDVEGVIKEELSGIQVTVYDLV